MSALSMESSGSGSESEAISIAYYRGYAVSKSAPEGLMAAVGLREHLVRDRIKGLGFGATIAIACVNSPDSVTVSGDSESILSLTTALQAEGVFIRPLQTDNKAYHSHHNAAVGELYQQLLDGLYLFGKQASADDTVGICMSSTVTCKVLHSETARTTAYWRTNFESPVQFSGGLLGLSKSFNHNTWIEIGAHSTLKLPILQTLGKSTSYIATLKRNQDSTVSLLTCVGELFTHDFNVDFSSSLRATIMGRLDSSMISRLTPGITRRFNG
ncbi:acyl transferase [Aspergillus germanicus]